MSRRKMLSDMWDYTRSKLLDWWHTLRGDLMLAIFGLVAAYLAAASDPLKFGLGEVAQELVVAEYFALFIAIFFVGVALFALLRVAFWGRRVRIDVRLGSKQGRPNFGRYLVMYLENRSLEDIGLFSVKLLDVRDTSGEWRPDGNLIARQDEFLWGSAMIKSGVYDRTGKKTLLKHEVDDTIIDLLHTGDGTDPDRVYFTMQYIGELINIPSGVYEVDIEFRGLHMLQKFSFPVTFGFRFDGGMELHDICIIKSDEHITRVSLEYNDEIVILTE